VLVRHAEPGLAPLDRDRPLTPRGERQAQAAGAWLREAGTVPDRVVVSPALRTRQTWERVAAELDSAPEPVVDDRVYENTLDGVLESIAESADDVRTLVVVGHNPTVAALAHELDDGDGDAAAREALDRGVPAGTLLVFDVEVPFAELGADGGTLVAVVVAP
jgi:phosphohistidine phosphatase